MFGERAREYGAHLAFVNLVGGQDELVFDGQSLLLGPDGTVLARAAAVRGGAADRRDPRPRPGRTATPLADAPPRPRRGLRRARPRPPRLRRKERLRPRRPRDLRRDRLGAGRDARGRRARPRAGDAGRHALAPLQRRDPGGRPPDRPQPRHRADRDRDRADDGRLPRRARRPPAPRRRGCRRLPDRPDPARGARPRRREHPGADPRQPDDGALQPPRLAGPDDRQQERDVGRLRDPLRRHGGRLRGDQGRAEDAGLRAGRTAQRDAPGASWSRPR